jgi:4a-hydroxytetrahydrobiopterin dehydratase
LDTIGTAKHPLYSCRPRDKVYHGSMDKLQREDIEKRLTELKGWTLQDGKLHKEFAFDSFTAAFGFMAQLALVAEKLGHHPDWSNSYNKVTINLTTHSAGGITERDFELAEQADQLAADSGNE